MKKKNCRFTGMKTRVHILLFLITGILLAAACSKGGTSAGNNGGGPTPSPNDTIAPVLNITTPTANQVFTSGNVINVTGRITDDLGLFRGSIRITNDANGALLKEQLYEIHYVLAYDYNISYTTNVVSVANYTITVFFEDHGFNSATKSVKVQVNP
jgi:phosphate-selective porin